MSDNFKNWIKEANSWEADKTASILRANTFYKIGFSVISAILLVLLLGTTRALYKIDTPHIVPVVLHENDDGIVTHVTTQHTQNGHDANIIQIKSYIHSYVVLREGYYRHGIEARFDEVQDKTHPSIMDNYRNHVRGVQIKRFGETHHQDIKIKHIDILDYKSRTAEVFFKVKSDLDDQWDERRVMIGWVFDDEINAESAIKYHNPHGFKVDRYEVISNGDE